MASTSRSCPAWSASFAFFSLLGEQILLVRWRNGGGGEGGGRGESKRAAGKGSRQGGEAGRGERIKAEVETEERENNGEEG